MVYFYLPSSDIKLRTINIKKKKKKGKKDWIKITFKGADILAQKAMKEQNCGRLSPEMASTNSPANPGHICHCFSPVKR